MSGHPNPLVNTMALLGYGLADMLPAHPGKDLTYVDQVMRDSALALSRPVIPYGLLGIHEARSPYFNLSAHGFRWAGEAQPWPPAPTAINVFFFGGSTTLGFNVEDGDTVPSLLRRHLKIFNPAIEVYNFGCGNYASRHEALRFLDLLDNGFKPDLAVFLDGYNDSFYGLGNRALVDVLDRLYQSEKRRRRKGWAPAISDYAQESRRERSRPMPSATNQGIDSDDPEVLALTSPEGIAAALTAAEPQSSFTLTPGLRHLAERIWSGWLDSNAMIEALAARHTVRTLFAWQPVPLFETPARARIMDRLHTVFPNTAFCTAAYHWLAQEEFPGLGKGTQFLDLSRIGAGLDRVAYVDQCHYNATLADLIAQSLTPRVIELLPRR